jgi:hypothetical protein
MNASKRVMRQGKMKKEEKLTITTLPVIVQAPNILRRVDECGCKKLK